MHYYEGGKCNKFILCIRIQLKLRTVCTIIAGHRSVFDYDLKRPRKLQNFIVDKGT